MLPHTDYIKDVDLFIFVDIKSGACKSNSNRSGSRLISRGNPDRIGISARCGTGDEEAAGVDGASGGIGNAPGEGDVADGIVVYIMTGSCKGDTPSGCYRRVKRS